MEEKNELNDIILNKNNGANNNKKIILVVATLGIILIIVIMLMNSLTSTGTDNLPQAVLPPEPKTVAAEQAVEEPLFEDVDVVQEAKVDDSNLDKIAQRLKEESKTEIVPEEKAEDKTEAPQKTVPAKVETKSAHVPEAKILKPTATQSFYVQVGSFSTKEPSRKLLKSLTEKNFKYQYNKVNNVNKVLVGPFDSEKEARVALKTIRGSIESGAFITKI